MQTDASRRPLSLDAVTVTDGFWGERRRTNRDVTIRHQYDQLGESGCLDNFRRAAGDADGEFEGMWFADTDAYKWLEAAADAQRSDPDPERAERMTAVIDLIAAAQEGDGYLDTYFQIEEPDGRWSNLNMMHELYCAGHLIEAATAHHRATGSDTLLDVAVDFADLLCDVFGPEGREGAPGHEEVELALVDLYRVTGTERYLDLAEHFVDVRGTERSRLRWELSHLDEIAGSEDIDEGSAYVFREDGEYDGQYAQDHAPIREQTAVQGHAVRAMYLYSGAADLLLEGRGDDDLATALDRLWANMTERRMYVTGGIGPAHDHEGFTDDYDLPNDSAYAETCAAVGSVFWTHRLAQLDRDARYADLVERTLYNGFLAGVSRDGTEFFYVNPLASEGDHHRDGWFECACCPPNVARLLASLERYLYLRDGETLYVEQYVGSEAEVAFDAPVTVTQTADFPWAGTAEFSVEGSATFDLALRVPSWAEDVSISVNGSAADPDREDGYAILSRAWDDDTVSVAFEMSAARVAAHPAVEADAGRLALQRGPLVYCLEDADNEHSVGHLRLPADGDVSPAESDALGGVTTLTGDALVATDWGDDLYRPMDAVEHDDTTFTAVPYYAWDNRESGAMRVWVPTPP